MPSGGKRPGAGAKPGNFNAMRSGNRSRRMLMVYLALVDHPDKLAVGRELAEHGLIHPPRGPRKMCFDGDMRPIVAYLYHRWFDGSDDEQSHSIKNDHPATLVTPSAESETAPQSPEIAAEEKNARKQRTIKPPPATTLPAIADEDEVQ